VGTEWSEEGLDPADGDANVEFNELLDLVSSADSSPPGPPGRPAPPPGGELQTIERLRCRVAELEPLGDRLADTEQRRVALVVQMRVLQEERDALAAERVERAALKRRVQRLEEELQRTRQSEESAERELSQTRMHMQDVDAHSGDWAKEAMQLRKKVDAANAALDASRQRLKAGGDALHGIVDGGRAVRRQDLRRLANLMAVESGDADAMVNELRHLFAEGEGGR